MKLGCLASPLFALALLCAAGCTSGDTQPNGARPMTFVAAEPSEGPSVLLRSQPTSVLFPDRITVDVVARGAADLHGAAFRLSWDSSALGFIEAKSGAPWSKQALAMAKEGSPGELAVVWAEKGESGIDASGETVLGTIVFEVHGRRGTTLGFKSERSQLVDKKGVRVEATWAGGAIAAR
jgi:hypothetical protein